MLAAGITAFGALAFALLLDESVSRAVSVGFYMVGSFLTIAGFFVGNRGPVRLKRDVGVPLFGSRIVRWATPEERRGVDQHVRHLRCTWICTYLPWRPCRHEVQPCLNNRH